MRTGKFNHPNLISPIRIDGADDGYEAELLNTVSNLVSIGKSPFPKTFKDLSLPKFKDLLVPMDNESQPLSPGSPEIKLKDGYSKLGSVIGTDLALRIQGATKFKKIQKDIAGQVNEAEALSRSKTGVSNYGI